MPVSLYFKVTACLWLQYCDESKDSVDFSICPVSSSKNSSDGIHHHSKVWEIHHVRHLGSKMRVGQSITLTQCQKIWVYFRDIISLFVTWSNFTCLRILWGNKCDRWEGLSVMLRWPHSSSLEPVALARQKEDFRFLWHLFSLMSSYNSSDLPSCQK